MNTLVKAPVKRKITASGCPEERESSISEQSPVDGIALDTANLGCSQRGTQTGPGCTFVAEIFRANGKAELKMSYITAIVTGAASLGICLGLILGVSFLFLLGLRWAR
ncbi:hypothetical protein RUM44_011765 [Polyplax serrata]|uniref:Uncharacterized protein n=1 Tax=Polyplax serrata TaxID=468196 RepID=A0ABR1AR18_POLSC